MKLPISWLKDYIDLDGLSIEEIARKLTLAGLEVDRTRGTVKLNPVIHDGRLPLLSLADWKTVYQYDQGRRVRRDTRSSDQEAGRVS